MPPAGSAWSRRDWAGRSAGRAERRAGPDVGPHPVVRALADACKRAIEDETPPNTKERKRKIVFYATCAQVLDEAAAKIKEAS